MKLPEPLDNLRNMKHALWVGIALTFLLDLGLLLIATLMEPNTGYIVLIAGLVVVTFLVPYIFGWRDGKRLALVGVVLFLVLGAVNGPLMLHMTYSMGEPDMVNSAYDVLWHNKTHVELADGILVSGGVEYALVGGGLEPYKGAVGDAYRFNVTLYSNGSFGQPPDVYVGYAQGVVGATDSQPMTEVDANDTNYLDGKEFYYDMAMDNPGIYYHWYALHLGSELTAHSLNTTSALGPLVGSETDSWGLYVPLGAVSMFCNIGMMFVIVVLLYWWIGTAKEKRKMWDQTLREKEEELDGEEDAEPEDDKPFTCDNCGASVGADDKFCPKCGERFDEEPEDADTGEDANIAGENPKAPAPADDKGTDGE